MNFNHLYLKLFKGKTERDILNDEIDKEMEKKELKNLKIKLEKLRGENKWIKYLYI